MRVLSWNRDHVLNPGQTFFLFLCLLYFAGEAPVCRVQIKLFHNSGFETPMFIHLSHTQDPATFLSQIHIHFFV
ncbi:hypothetical protein GQ54DRAFT_50988 [Martensiomyces pterosporus]|nr:hypothetical protein GQ54DRAFT_50988 [Martensiomyces pterosporus]